MTINILGSRLHKFIVSIKFQFVTKIWSYCIELESFGLKYQKCLRQIGVRNSSTAVAHFMYLYDHAKSVKAFGRVNLQNMLYS